MIWRPFCRRKALRGAVKTRGRAHEFADFNVLKAPDVPSVLVQMGLLSSREDEKLMKNSVYRQRLVEAIARGIDRYFRIEVKIKPVR